MTVLQIPAGLTPLSEVARWMVEAENAADSIDRDSVRFDPIGDDSWLRRKGFPHEEWLLFGNDLNRVLEAPDSSAVTPDEWDARNTELERWLSQLRTHTLDITCGWCESRPGRLSQRVIAKFGRFSDIDNGISPLWMPYKLATSPLGELGFDFQSEELECPFCPYDDHDGGGVFTLSPATQAILETQIMGTPRRKISIKRISQNAMSMSRDQVFAILTTGTYIPQHA